MWGLEIPQHRWGMKMTLWDKLIQPGWRGWGKVAFKHVKSITGNEVTLFGSPQGHWRCLNPRKPSSQSCEDMIRGKMSWERP